MPDKKLFYLHIEIGQEQGLYYAKCVLGNHALEFKQMAGDICDAIQMLIVDMGANGVYTSLTRDPSFSVFPLSGHVHQAPTFSSSGGGHSHSVTSIATAIFNLHIEVGNGAGGVGCYARTEFLNPYIEFRSFTPNYMDDAICDLISELDDAGVFIQLLNQPKSSAFPFQSPSSSVSSSSTSSPPQAATKKKDIVRELPSACIGYADITCRDHCTSWDCFGRVKCKNMCSWRKEI